VRTSPVPKSSARINGGGLEVNIEVGVKIAAGATFAFRGIKASIFTAATAKKGLFCDVDNKWPIRPTNAVMRTWVEGSGGALSASLVDGCSAQIGED
jgi:hypothetical protein